MPGNWFLSEERDLIILAYFSFLREKVDLWDDCALWPKLLNQVAYFHGIPYEGYATESHLTLVFLFPIIDEDARIYEAGATLAPLNVRFWKDVWQKVFDNFQI
jgi:hypothetical protein